MRLVANSIFVLLFSSAAFAAPIDESKIVDKLDKIESKLQEIESKASRRTLSDSNSLIKNQNPNDELTKRINELEERNKLLQEKLDNFEKKLSQANSSNSNNSDSSSYQTEPTTSNQSKQGESKPNNNRQLTEAEKAFEEEASSKTDDITKSQTNNTQDVSSQAEEDVEQKPETSNEQNTQATEEEKPLTKQEMMLDSSAIKFYNPVARIKDSDLQKFLADFNAKNYDKVIVALEKFVEKNKDKEISGNAHFIIAEAYQAKSMLKQAAVHYLKTYKDYPESEMAPEALLKLAQYVASTKQKQKACKLLNKLESEYPERHEINKRIANKDKVKFHCEIVG